MSILSIGALKCGAVAVCLAAPPSAPAPSAPSAAPSAPASQSPAEEAMAPARVERMLAAGDSLPIVQLFRRHPAAVLPFIDGYLEGGLARIEKGEAPEAVEGDFRTAVRFAELANQAFGEAIFTEYAAAFAGWSPGEQKRFREGQALFREGRSKAKDDPAAALPLLRRSVVIAEALGDHWGVAMGQLASAELLLAQERIEEAHETSIRAIELFGRLQLRPSYIRALRLCASIRQRMQTPDMGSGQLRMALQVLPADAPEGQRAEIVEELCAVLERVGRRDEADRMREAESRRKSLLP